MAKAAQSPELKAAFEKHETETKDHVARLEEIFDEIDETPRGKTCDAIMGIIEEGQEVMKEFKGRPSPGRRPPCRGAGGRALRDRPLRDPQNVGRGTRLEPGGRASGDDARRRKEDRRNAHRCSPRGGSIDTRRRLDARNDQRSLPREDCRRARGFCLLISGLVGSRQHVVSFKKELTRAR